jgi:hypothetical protein
LDDSLVAVHKHETQFALQRMRSGQSLKIVAPLASDFRYILDVIDSGG